MPLKLSIAETASTPAKIYGVFVSCNKCGGTHDVGISVTLEGGPVVKQSIAALYGGHPLPKILSDLSNHSVSCPMTGRQSTQKDNHHIFLVPPKS